MFRFLWRKKQANAAEVAPSIDTTTPCAQCNANVALTTTPEERFDGDVATLFGECSRCHQQHFMRVVVPRPADFDVRPADEPNVVMTWAKPSVTDGTVSFQQAEPSQDGAVPLTWNV